MDQHKGRSNRTQERTVGRFHTAAAPTETPDTPIAGCAPPSCSDLPIRGRPG
jgi:hypothetical protein